MILANPLCPRNVTAFPGGAGEGQEAYFLFNLTEGAFPMAPPDLTAAHRHCPWGALEAAQMSLTFEEAAWGTYFNATLSYPPGN